MILTIPKSERKAEILVVIADAKETIFGPTIDPRAGMIVWEEFPGGAIGAVIFADGAPGACGEIRTPALPVFYAPFGVGEALLLGSECRHGASFRVDGGGRSEESGDRSQEAVAKR